MQSNSNAREIPNEFTNEKTNSNLLRYYNFALLKICLIPKGFFASIINLRTSPVDITFGFEKNRNQ